MNFHKTNEKKGYLIQNEVIKSKKISKVDFILYFQIYLSNGFLLYSVLKVMHNLVLLEIEGQKITLELNDEFSPKTVKTFLESIPFDVNLNVWGEEIYSSPSPITASKENAKSPVELNDVAYWPTGKAICLFYGPTPIGKKGEITPASPVNVIGKIMSPDKSVLEIADGRQGTFRLSS